MDELYLGYDRWLPSPPIVKKPRSVYNAASLAYLGDCIYEVSFSFNFCSSAFEITISDYDAQYMCGV